MFDISVAEKIATLRKLFNQEIAAGIFTRDALVLDQIIRELTLKAEQSENS